MNAGASFEYYFRKYPLLKVDCYFYAFVKYCDHGRISSLGIFIFDLVRDNTHSFYWLECFKWLIYVVKISTIFLFVRIYTLHFGFKSFLLYGIKSHVRIIMPRSFDNDICASIIGKQEKLFEFYYHNVGRCEAEVSVEGSGQRVIECAQQWGVVRSCEQIKYEIVGLYCVAFSYLLYCAYICTYICTYILPP